MLRLVGRSDLNSPCDSLSMWLILKVADAGNVVLSVFSLLSDDNTQVSVTPSLPKKDTVPLNVFSPLFSSIESPETE